jgi:hypothetical protein
MNENILASKIGSLQITPPPKKMVIFSKTAVMILTKLKDFMDFFALIKLIRLYLQENNGTRTAGVNARY